MNWQNRAFFKSRHYLKVLNVWGGAWRFFVAYLIMCFSFGKFADEKSILNQQL